MSATREETLSLVSMAIGTISKLNKKEVRSLLDGNSVFAVKKVSKCKTIKTKYKIEYKDSEYIKTLYSLHTREEVRSYLQQLKFTKSELIFLAKELAVFINTSSRKDVIIDKIIESVLGKKP